VTPQPLERAELKRLLGARMSKRDRALLALLYRAGLRCAEACAMRMEDIRCVQARLIVKVSKPKNLARGAPQRELGLDPKTESILREWLQTRGDAPGFVFGTRTGSAVDTSHVRRVLGRLRKRTGIQRRVHAHGLRHTFARELYDEGIGLREIQDALGHRNLATTDRYLRTLGVSAAVAATQGRTW